MSDRFKKVIIAGDGNCLFRCFSYFMHQCDEQYHLLIREMIVNYVENNTCTFIDFNLNFEEYLLNMRLNGTYGDNMEIQAFSRLFRINVHVHVLNKSEKDHKITISNVNKCIHLLYDDINHYNILIDLFIDNLDNAPSSVYEESNNESDNYCSDHNNLNSDKKKQSRKPRSDLQKYKNNIRNQKSNMSPSKILHHNLMNQKSNMSPEKVLHQNLMHQKSNMSPEKVLHQNLMHQKSNMSPEKVYIKI